MSGCGSVRGEGEEDEEDEEDWEDEEDEEDKEYFGISRIRNAAARVRRASLTVNVE